MKAFRKFIHLLLIITMLSVAFPFVHPQDANRDDRLDLSDMILNVRELIRSAEKPDTFAASLGNAVSTLQLLAGLKTVIKADNHARTFVTPLSLDLPFLISAFSLSDALNDYGRVSEKNLYYHSIILTPSSPPPRTVSIS